MTWEVFCSSIKMNQTSFRFSFCYIICLDTVQVSCTHKAKHQQNRKTGIAWICTWEIFTRLNISLVQMILRILGSSIIDSMWMLMHFFLLLRARSSNKHCADLSGGYFGIESLCWFNHGWFFFALECKIKKTNWLFRGELPELNCIENVGRSENVRKMK